MEKDEIFIISKINAANFIACDTKSSSRLTIFRKGIPYFDYWALKVVDSR